MISENLKRVEMKVFSRIFMSTNNRLKYKKLSSIIWRKTWRRV
jgi:hypothetical protein